MSNSSNSTKRRRKLSASNQSTSEIQGSGSYFETALGNAGLIIDKSGGKHILKKEPINFTKCLRDSLEKHLDYPTNIKDFIEDYKKITDNLNMLKSLITPNISLEDDFSSDRVIQDSVTKLLLSLNCLQEKLMTCLFEKASEFGIDDKPVWVQMILKCFVLLDNLVSTEKLTSCLIDLMDVSGHSSRLEIISTLPDIIADQENDSIPLELSRYITEDYDLIPAILECFTYLYLPIELKQSILTKMLNLLRTSAPLKFFPNLVKFLLGIDTSDLIIEGLRTGLDWTIIGNQSEADVYTSQMLTIASLRLAIASSKQLAQNWLKIINSFKLFTDYKCLDFIMLLILHSTSQSREKTVENLMKKQIKLIILKEDTLKETFAKFRFVLKEYLNDMLKICNALLRMKAEPAVPLFATKWYSEIFIKLEDSRHAMVTELLLLQGGSDGISTATGPLDVLSSIVLTDVNLLKPHSLKLLSLVDKIEDVDLNETRKIMQLLCALAYGTDTSILRDDIHMIILKQLGRSDPIIKAKGIVGGVLATKYLMANYNNEDSNMENSNHSNIHLLPDGPIKDAATLIELISKSCQRYPEICNLFYDEFSSMLMSQNINRTFLSWLYDAITNDLQNNFIYDVGPEANEDVKKSLQYCLNSEDEQADVIAVNVMEYPMQSLTGHSDIRVLPSLFRLMRIVHQQHNKGDLSSIDALLGSPVLIPSMDVNIFMENDREQQNNILNAMIHCANWFRELLNAFCGQNDEVLQQKVVQRVIDLEGLENNILNFLLKMKSIYQPPIYNLPSIKSNNPLVDVHEAKPKKLNSKKKTNKKRPADNDQICLSETVHTQGIDDLPPTATTQIELQTVTKYGKLNKEYFRDLDFSTLALFNNHMSIEANGDNDPPRLPMSSLAFLLDELNPKLKATLTFEAKRNPFSKPKVNNERGKPEDLMKNILIRLPRVRLFLDDIGGYLKKSLENCDGVRDSISLLTKKTATTQKCLELLLDFLEIFFTWPGFHCSENELYLKRALHILSKTKTDLNKVLLKNLTRECCKQLVKFKDWCLQVTTAVSLVKLLQRLSQLYSDDSIISIIMETCYSFLQLSWRNELGESEKGFTFNQAIDRIISGYFMRPDIETVKSLTYQLKEQAPKLQTKNDVLSEFHCINKLNFPLIFRGTCAGLYEATKYQVDKGLTDNEHLELWKNVALILKILSEVAKIHENRINLSIYLKKCLPLIKYFLSQGMPIMEMKLKSEPDLVIEILRLLQQSTRFLHSLCCHSRVKKDTSLISKVPQMKSLLETLVCKVKAALAANNCSEAFWMGNLKNKNIQGEVILSQSSTDDVTETPEDEEDRLSDDDEDSLQSDDMTLNPESKSVSDIV